MMDIIPWNAGDRDVETKEPVDPDKLPKGHIIGNYEVKYYRTNIGGSEEFTKSLFFRRLGGSNITRETKVKFRVERILFNKPDGAWRIVHHFLIDDNWYRWGNRPAPSVEEYGLVTILSERDEFSEGQLVNGVDFTLETEQRTTGEREWFVWGHTVSSGWLYLTGLNQDPPTADPFPISITDIRRSVFSDQPSDNTRLLRAFGSKTQRE